MSASVRGVSPLEQMLREQIAERGITDGRIIDAMRAVPREVFFSDRNRRDAFADRATPIGHAQTISQPYVVALMSERLDVEATHRVLEIGTGSGYQTAILAHLAREVYSVERIKPLLDDAFERLHSVGVRNVHFRFGDGFAGWPEQAPFDRLILTCAPFELPTDLLLTHLADRGVAVLPVGPSDSQELLRVERVGDRLDTRHICTVRFVPMVAGD